jgi:ribonuclease BN (tRNA processing enzyme)
MCVYTVIPVCETNTFCLSGQGCEEPLSVEFPTSQQQILLTSHFHPALFPRPLPGLGLSGSQYNPTVLATSQLTTFPIVRAASCEQIYFVFIREVVSAHAEATEISGWEEEYESDADDDNDDSSSDDEMLKKRHRGLENVGTSCEEQFCSHLQEELIGFRSYYGLRTTADAESCVQSSSMAYKDLVPSSTSRQCVQDSINHRHVEYLAKLSSFDRASVAPDMKDSESAGNLLSLTFLGTGCASPSKFRHNSAIMLTFGARIPPQILGPPATLKWRPPPPPGPPPSPPSPGPFSPRPYSPSPDLPLLSTPRVPADNSFTDIGVLLDCGEGCAAQLFQQHNGNVCKFDTALVNIRLIWISHRHADHVCGLPMLIQHVHKATLRRYKAELLRFKDAQRSDSTVDKPPKPELVPAKILIVGPKDVLDYYSFALAISGLDDYITILPTTSTLYAGNCREVALATQGRISRLVSVPVFHCRDAYACVVEMPDVHSVDPSTPIRKLVYSGDCRPSPSLLAAGKFCDILIHEATFADDMLDDAVSKKHSTYSEAIEMARKLCVGHISGSRVRYGVGPEGLVILTHFSQRYITSSSASAGDVDSSVYSASAGAEGTTSHVDKNSIDIDDLVSDSASADVPSVSKGAARIGVETTPMLPVVTAVDFLKISYPSQRALAVAASRHINAMQQCLQASSALSKDE